jgi:hypothetical protein
MLYGGTCEDTLDVGKCCKAQMPKDFAGITRALSATTLRTLHKFKHPSLSSVSLDLLIEIIYIFGTILNNIPFS